MYVWTVTWSSLGRDGSCYGTVLKYCYYTHVLYVSYEFDLLMSQYLLSFSSCVICVLVNFVLDKKTPR